MDLQDALRSELAAVTEPAVDHQLLLRAVASRNQRRRRRALASGAVVALLAVASGAAVLAVADGAPDRGRAILVTNPGGPTPTPSTGAGESFAATTLLPTYLPAGARLVLDKLDTTTFPGQAVRTLDWSLPGAANLDTIPSGPDREMVDAAHPGTDLQLTVTDKVPPGSLAPPRGIGGGSRFTTYRIRGQVVTGFEEKNGYGAVRLDWAEGGHAYHLSVDRLSTLSGRSGVPLSELVRVAQGMTPPGPDTSPPTDMSGGDPGPRATVSPAAATPATPPTASPVRLPVSYEGGQVVFSPPVRGQAPGVSRTQALAAFRKTGGNRYAQVPDMEFAVFSTTSGLQPPASDADGVGPKGTFPVWMITYENVPVVGDGPSSANHNFVEDVIGIVSARSGQVLEIVTAVPD